MIKKRAFLNNENFIQSFLVLLHILSDNLLFCSSLKLSRFSLAILTFSLKGAPG